MRSRLILSLYLIVLILLLSAGNLFAVTYSYNETPSPRTWYNANYSNGRWIEGSEDVTQEKEKMLVLGSFFIDGLTPDSLDSNPDNNYVYLRAYTYGGMYWVTINGPFSGNIIKTGNNVNTNLYSYDQQLKGYDFSIYMQYEDKDGVHMETIHSVNTVQETDYKIMLNPPNGQTSITCKIFILTNPVKMELGHTYTIENLNANTRYIMLDKNKNGIQGTNFDPYNNHYVQTETVDSHSSGESELPKLDATVKLLSYPNREELTSGSEIALPNNAAKLAQGVPLAYLWADFSEKNTGGDTKSLLIKITHDEFKPQTNNGNKSYAYTLSLSQDLLNGSVTTEYGNNGQEDGTGLLSYRLKNSQPNDYDSKLITFTMAESEDFQNARPGTYTSNVLIVTSVE